VTASDIATIVAAYTGVAVVVGGISWKLFKNAVSKAVEENRPDKEAISELRHNGGSSLLDVVKLQLLPMVKELNGDVKELRQNQIIIDTKLSKLEGRFEQHVDEAQE
jgi:hypothetical protein